MKYLAVFFIAALILLAGCQRYNKPDATVNYPQQLASSSTIQATSSSTTSIFDCKSCQPGFICRNNECIKVEYSNTGGSGSSGSSY